MLSQPFRLKYLRTFIIKFFILFYLLFFIFLSVPEAHAGFDFVTVYFRAASRVNRFKVLKYFLYKVFHFVFLLVFLLWLHHSTRSVTQPSQKNRISKNFFYKSPGNRQITPPAPGIDHFYSAPCTNFLPHFYALYQIKENNCNRHQKYSIIN